MAANDTVRPVKPVGVVVVVLVSVVWAAGIFFDAMTVSNTTGRVSGQFNMAEAAMISAGYTRVVYETLALIGFDILCLGAAICNRLSRLHEAVQASSAPRPQA